MPPKKVTPRGRAAAPPVGDQVANAPSLKQTVSSTPVEAPEAPANPRAHQFYVRNVRNIPVSLRLTNTTNRRIELEPRGNRQDMSSISDEEFYDQILLSNVGYIIEVISADKARDIITKQYTNAAPGQRQQSLLDMITDETGKPVTGASLEKSNVEGAITVGRIDEIEHGSGHVAKSESISRVTAEDRERMLNPTQRGFHAPGSTTSPIPLVPDSIPPEQHADWLAAQDPYTYVQALRAAALGNREQD